MPEMLSLSQKRCEIFQKIFQLDVTVVAGRAMGEQWLDNASMRQSPLGRPVFGKFGPPERKDAL
jgi:hypothetical protein